MNHTPKPTPKSVERAIHRSNKTLENLIVQTPDEVEETEAIIGDTPCERPARLRNAGEVLERIIRSQSERSEPTALGKTVTLMRTQKRLSVDELAKRTDLDREDILEIENNSNLDADPMIVVVLAEFFRVPVQTMQRLAELTQHSDLGEEFGSLHLAAGATPEFEKHTDEEKKSLYRWMSQIREQGKNR